MTTRLFFLLLLPLCLNAASPAKIDFYKGSLNSAKEMAYDEGKLYFVQFTASWCEPCRWMDEVTYKDPAVVTYINENYIPVKVDIDDFDGFAYKQMYNIKMLPSVLVFSSKGDLLGKYEESLAPLKMLKILKTHNLPENRSQPKTYTQIESLRIPEAKTNHSPIKNNVTRPALKPSEPRPEFLVEEEDADVYLSDMEDEFVNEKIEEIAAEESTNEVNDASRISQKYSVQIGVYSTYRNVEEKAAKVKKKFDDRIIVHERTSSGKTSYLVMLGEFSNRETANNFRKKVEANGFSGIVKDLSSLK